MSLIFFSIVKNIIQSANLPTEINKYMKGQSKSGEKKKPTKIQCAVNQYANEDFRPPFNRAAISTTLRFNTVQNLPLYLLQFPPFLPPTLPVSINLHPSDLLLGDFKNTVWRLLRISSNYPSVAKCQITACVQGRAELCSIPAKISAGPRKSYFLSSDGFYGGIQQEPCASDEQERNTCTPACALIHAHTQAHTLAVFWQKRLLYNLSRNWRKCKNSDKNKVKCWWTITIGGCKWNFGSFSNKYSSHATFGKIAWQLSYSYFSSSVQFL